MASSSRTTRAGSVAALALLALPLQALASSSDHPAVGPLFAHGLQLQQCEITFEPNEISIQGDSANVVAEFSESIGLIHEIAFPEGSGLEVTSDAPTPIAEGRFQIVVNTESAQAGEWTVTVTGSDGTCAGTLRVVADTPEPAPQTVPAEPTPEPTPDPAPMPEPTPDPAPLPDPDPDPAPMPDPVPGSTGAPEVGSDSRNA